MSDEARNFVRTLLEGPDDPANLLVFADWLEDNGDPRAELVRVQGEAVRWDPDQARRGELERRDEQLRESLAHAWLGPLASACKAYCLSHGLAHVTLDARKLTGRRFAAEAGRWFRNALVGTVRVEGLQPACVHALATAPCLGDTPGLDLGGVRLTPQALALLLSNPHLRGVTWLDLSNNHLGDAALLRLLDWPGFANLAWLDLRNTDLTSAAAASLLRSAGPRLRHLDLHGNPLDEASHRAAANWRCEHDPLFDGEPPRRLINSIGMELALVPAGEFLMGSPNGEAERVTTEGPRHVIALSRPFYLGVYPVTQGQYEAVTRSNPSHFSAARKRGGPTHPADSVTWEMAAAFCRALSNLPAEREAGRRYRLPTEAEWEHACRGGTSLHPFCWGPALSSRQANFDGIRPYGNAPRGVNLARSTPVGAYRQFHPFGLHDMHGNVWEWCHDFYSSKAYRVRGRPRTDPPGPDAPDNNRGHVLRGGSWMHYGQVLRAAFRGQLSPDQREPYVGLRVALDAE